MPYVNLGLGLESLTTNEISFFYNHTGNMMKIGAMSTCKLSNEKVYTERVMFPRIFYCYK